MVICLGPACRFLPCLTEQVLGVRAQKRDRLITQGQLCAEDKGNKDAPGSTSFTVPVSEDVVPGAVPSKGRLHQQAHRASWMAGHLADRCPTVWVPPGNDA